MPRKEMLGLVNHNLPDFRKIGVHKILARSCSMNYIHKRQAGCDIFFFTNTAGEAYKGSILLRGWHAPEEWNPYTGKIHKLTCEIVRFRGEIYTRTHLYVSAEHAVFLISRPNKKRTERIKAHAHTLRDVTTEINMMESTR